MDTTTLLKIIQEINLRVYNLEQDEDIWPEEHYFGIRHLELLKEHIQSLIKTKVDPTVEPSVQRTINKM